MEVKRSQRTVPIRMIPARPKLGICFPENALWGQFESVFRGVILGRVEVAEIGWFIGMSIN